MALGTVILVPGFLGSVLGDPPSFVFPARVVWLNPVSLLSGQFGRLRLPFAGDGLPSPGEPLTEGYPLPAYYGLLTGYLTYQGWDVIAPTADWREPLAFDASRLINVARAAMKKGPIRVVCHSRGGLLVRLLAQDLIATNELAALKRVVGLGVPHEGSLNAVLNLAGVGSLQNQIFELGASLPPFLKRRIASTTVYDVMRSWPALYQLMPKPGSRWMSSGTPDSLYDPAVYARSPLEVVPRYLTAARGSWAALPQVPINLDWVDVAGVGVPTASGVPDLALVTQKGELEFQETGDGTVEVGSAHQAGRRLIRTPTQHDLLVADGRLWPYIHSALIDGLAADVDLPGPVLTTRS